MIVTLVTNLIYRFFVFLWETIFFWNDLKLWKLRWLLFSHYFASDLWFQKCDGDFVYGETPFWTAGHLLNWSGVKKEDVIWDLGCGRGTFLFFAAIRYDCKTLGIDYIGIYPEVGKLIAGKLNLKKMEWLQADFSNLELWKLPSPNLVYLACTTFSDQTMKKTVERLESLRAGVKVITLSAAIESKCFRLIEKKICYFSWGKATAYLHEKYR